MLAADCVLLGRGRTFKLRGLSVFDGYAFDLDHPEDGWSLHSCWRGLDHEMIYAAPRNSEVARLNGLGSNPKADAYRFIKPELLKRVQEMPCKESMLNELTRLREESERLAETEKDFKALARHCDGHDVHEMILNVCQWKGLREENERLNDDLAYANKAIESDHRLMLAACRLLHASGVDCGSKALCDAVREARKTDEANRNLREALEKAEHSLAWGDSEMKGRPPQHWTEALAQVRETLAKQKP